MSKSKIPTIIAVTALVVAVFGATPLGQAASSLVLPKNSVGAAQLKKNAITGMKIKDNQVTGADVKESSLGKVPAAQNADRATSADNATNATNAVDSAKLGGVAAANYQRPGAVLQSGQTEHGIGGAAGGADYMYVQLQFDPMLPADLDAAHTIHVTGTSGPHCPGIGQADPGYLCWYERTGGNASFMGTANPLAGGAGASREGALALYLGTAAHAWVVGEWAVTAP